MDQQIISHLLEKHPWLPTTQILDCVDSTNTFAKELARQGAPAGTVVIADRQRAGRGRLGRSFLSPGGVGIYFSVVLRPNCPPQSLMHLTCAVGTAMCNAIERACGIRPGIKWTNDLVIGTKKLGGILTELNVNPTTKLVEYAIVGIGINCKQKEADFDESIRNMACSIEMSTGKQVDRNTLICEMVRSMYALNQNLLSDKSQIMASYRRDCITLGKHISVVRGTDIRHGIAQDIDEDGALIVAYENGSVEAVQSGEVSIRGLYGYV